MLIRAEMNRFVAPVRRSGMFVRLENGGRGHAASKVDALSRTDLSHPGRTLATVANPVELGRSVVIRPGEPVPDDWRGSPTFAITAGLLGDGAALDKAVVEMHALWVARKPFVVELGVDQRVLAEPEVTDRTPWELGATFTFLRERLQHLVWANSWDHRLDQPVWWWAKKAERLGAQPGGERDVLLPDGTEAWIDGGPRGSVPEVGSIVHSESIVGGRLELERHGSTVDPDLAPDQREAVLHGAGAARVIAPAGSGKTRTLVARLRHLVDDLGYPIEGVTAVAYNTRAAREMADRVGPDRSRAVRTLHSLGRGVLLDAKGDLELLAERDVRRTLEPLVQAPRRPNTDIIGPYIEALSEVRIGLRDPAAVEADRDDVPGFAELFSRYRSRLANRRAHDFDEQIFGAIEALLAEPELRRRWHYRCRHLLVDEFQDLTPGYLLLIRLLASPELDVFGVGDDDQVIYGYAGADPRFLIHFDRLFPGAGHHALEVNYRCPAPVVEAAVHLLEGMLASGIELREPPRVHSRALELAEQLGQGAAYDAHYLALAETLDCELWTADERFYRAVVSDHSNVRWIGGTQA